MLSILAGYRTYIFCGIAVLFLLLAMIVHCTKGPKMTTKTVNIGGASVAVQVPAAVDPNAPPQSPYDLEFWLQIGGAIAVALAGVYRYVGQLNWTAALSTGAGLFDALSKAFGGKAAAELQEVKQVLTKVGESIPVSSTPPTGGSGTAPPAAARPGKVESPVLLNVCLILIIICGAVALWVAMSGNRHPVHPTNTGPKTTKPTGELIASHCNCCQTGVCTCAECHCNDDVIMPVMLQGSNRDQGPVSPPLDQRDNRFPNREPSREAFGLEEMAKAIREVLAWLRGAGNDLDKKYVEAKNTAGNVAIGTTVITVLNLIANVITAISLMIIAACMSSVVKGKPQAPPWMPSIR